MSKKQTVLVIDDDEGSLTIVKRFLEGFGLNVVTASDGISGMFLLTTEEPDLVISDLEMPLMTGLDVLHEVKEASPDTGVIIMTGFATVETAVNAMREGAIDYIQKPINLDHFRIIVNKALERKRLIIENRELRLELSGRFKFANIIGCNKTMQKIFKTIEKVAPTNANILIWGESGTGKELIARAIHTYSKRKNKEFVAVDCVSIPSHLIESELFGHEKGSFTGANNSRDGLLQLAEGGTFFMDEVTELDVDLQAKLLRTLQERQFRKVGGRKLINIDTRIVSATKRNPEQAVVDGYFREDLFYRLNVIPIHLPPLRERREDIPLLIQHFLKQNEQKDNIATTIEPDALEVLQAYNWPGNVRELKNIIERLSILASEDKIVVEELPTFIMMGIDNSSSDSWLTAFSYKEAKDKWLGRFEKNYITEMLKKYNNNISQAALSCGINRRTFHRMIQKHKIDIDRKTTINPKIDVNKKLRTPQV